MPVRLDDTVIPGIRPTLAYLDLRQHTIEDLAGFAVEKIVAAKAGSVARLSRPLFLLSNRPAALRSGNLRIKKQFTEQDRDTFLEDAYEVVARYFEESLRGLEVENPGIVGKFRRVNANHFSAKIYRDGKGVSAVPASASEAECSAKTRSSTVATLTRPTA